ncbi:MAG: glutamate dehydrogenase, partial [Thermoplasmata archaeon]
TLDEVYQRLDQKMTKAFWDVMEAMDKYKIEPRTAAYVVAVKRVADAVKIRGWA